MRRILAATATSITILFYTAFAAGEGLPISKYLEDPEHKNEILGFYLEAVFTGINLANARIKPPLFCMDQNNSDSAFANIDKRIVKLQKEKRITPTMTVDSIMLDILIDEYPCK